MKIKLTDLTEKQVDDYSWHAICGWPELSAVDVWNDHINYAELTRWFLWDKVSRATLYARNPTRFAQEYEPFRSVTFTPQAKTHVPSNVLSRFIHRYRPCNLSLKKEYRDSVRIDSHVLRNHERILYVPSISNRLFSTVEKLIEANTCQIVSRDSNKGLEAVSLLPSSNAGALDPVLAERICGGITKGLSQYGISLLPEDSDLLLQQVVNITRMVGVVDQELEILSPDAILVHGDNHPPHQVYVLIARKKGIPAIMLQHGLDCEHYCLDEAYASDIAVWGPERLERYREKSTFQPQINVTGNPAYDHLRPPTEIDTSGAFWLWLTRPHSPDKCYAPSRLPSEGLSILRALLKILETNPSRYLVIKPHSFDDHEFYSQEVEKVGMCGQVKVTDSAIPNLVSDATVVITEDSTAGMEAMFWGKSIVHAHFSGSLPTMPFVSYGTALAAFSPEEMETSLAKAERLTSAEKERICKAQRRFLSDFAGPCDGKAGDRVAGFIKGVLKNIERNKPSGMNE